MVHCLLTMVTVNTFMKKFCGRFVDLNTWKKFCLLLTVAMHLLFHCKTEIRYLCLPYIVKMEQFDTYSTH